MTAALEGDLEAIKAALRAAAPMSLLRVPASPAAEALADSIASQIAATEQRQRQRVQRQAAFVATVGKVIADLLVAFRDKKKKRLPDEELEGVPAALLPEAAHKGWCYRPMGKDIFSGDPDLPSYADTKRCIDGLHGLGLVERKTGYAKESAFANDKGKHYRSGHATRLRATAKLTGLAQQHEITPGNVIKHFRSLPQKNVIELRGASPGYDEYGKKIRGKRLKLPKTEEVTRLSAQVRELNDALRAVKLEGGTFLGFKRIYNDGRFDKGGRLYAVGGDSYQHDSKKSRLKMTMDGEPVVEIDLRASFLTMIYGLLGVRFDPGRGDPYGLRKAKGQKKVHRNVVKAWFTLAIGKHALPTKWTRSQRKNVNGIREHSPVKVGEAVLKLHPVLRTWLAGQRDSKDLMYSESEALIAAMLRLLREHHIPSLPVHDSLIVKVKDAEPAIRLLKTEYSKRCNGITPHVTVNMPWGRRGKAINAANIHPTEWTGPEF